METHAKSLAWHLAHTKGLIFASDCRHDIVVDTVLISFNLYNSQGRWVSSSLFYK